MKHNHIYFKTYFKTYNILCSINLVKYEIKSLFKNVLMHEIVVYLDYLVIIISFIAGK